MDPTVISGLTAAAAAVGGFLLRHLLNGRLSQPSDPTPAPQPKTPAAPIPHLPLPAPNTGHKLLDKLLAKGESYVEQMYEQWAERMLAGGPHPPAQPPAAKTP